MRELLHLKVSQNQLLPTILKFYITSTIEVQTRPQNPSMQNLRHSGVYFEVQEILPFSIPCDEIVCLKVIIPPNFQNDPSEHPKTGSKAYKRKKASSCLEAFYSSGEQDRAADLRVMNPAL